MDKAVIVRLPGPDEASVLGRVAPGVSHNAVDPRCTAEFFADPRHHLASALHHVHPDKPPELYVSEVGVAPA